MTARRAFFLALIGTVFVASLLLVVRSRSLTEPRFDPSNYVTHQDQAMATSIQVTVPAGDSSAVAAEDVFALFRRLDEELSEWKPASPLAAVNRAAGREAVPVPGELLALLRRSIEIGRLTDGAFDVSWAALWGLWDFKASDPRLPDEAEVARRAALVDFRRIEIDTLARTVRLPQEGMALGLGGIAKGYALDRARDGLRQRGISSFLIQAGGQVVVEGLRGDRPWRIGIRDPRGPADDTFAELEAANVSVSTSGDYESFFVLNGKRYHHILNPRTGWPATGVRSATVVCPDATLADALSTALLVLGVERGLAILNRFPGSEGVLVDDQGVVHASPGAQARLRMIHPPRHGL